MRTFMLAMFSASLLFVLVGKAPTAIPGRRLSHDESSHVYGALCLKKKFSQLTCNLSHGGSGGGIGLLYQVTEFEGGNQNIGAAKCPCDNSQNPTYYAVVASGCGGGEDPPEDP
jgi:hypothetical protein